MSLLAIISQYNTTAGGGEVPLGSGRIFYVSPTGADSNSGLSTDEPWQSVSKVNSVDLLPGDTVAFEGGSTFTGKLTITDSGAEGNPITITSYGTGKAVLTNGDATAVKLLDCEWVTVDGVKVNGPGVDTSGNTTSYGFGIVAYSTSEATGYLYGVKIKNCEVWGHRVGICALSDKTGDDVIYREKPGTTRQLTWKGYSGFEVTGCEVSYCSMLGIAMYARINYLDDLGFPTFTNQTGAHEYPYIANNYVHHLYGKNGTGFHDTYYGTGIRTISCTGGIVERNRVYEVGHMANGVYGTPCGLETESCKDMLWQYNEVSHVKFNGPVRYDGGVDVFDGNCQNIILQYNYIHNCDGYGIGGGNHGFGNPNTGNIARFNVLVNNDAFGELGDIQIWGQCDNTLFYNNTIYNDRPSGKALVWLNGNPVTPWFVNNIFYGPNKPVMIAPAGASLVNNLYWKGSTGANLGVTLAGTTYNSLTALRAAGKEVYNSTNYGMEANPLFVAPGTTPSILMGSPVSTLTLYDLQAASPAKGVGIVVSQLGNMGTQDYHEQTIGQLSIGADCVEAV